MRNDIYAGDALARYDEWDTPKVIMSDGPYGLGIFPGETRDAEDLQAIYEPHVAAWSLAAKPNTTLWFWCSELGWGETHTLLRNYRWVYQEAIIWDKGPGHIAGKVNSKTVKGVPVSTEICVRYTQEPDIEGLHLRDWLRREWKRSGLPMSRANEACGVRSAATRKWLTNDHLWYAPDRAAVEAMGRFCAQHGTPTDRPYFDMSGFDYDELFPTWNHQHGFTNVWQEPAVRGVERIKVNGATAHPNQKPLSLMRRIIELSSNPGDVIWEPFGGLSSASVAARDLGRSYCTAEINPTFSELSRHRLTS